MKQLEQEKKYLLFPQLLRVLGQSEISPYDSGYPMTYPSLEAGEAVICEYVTLLKEEKLLICDNLSEMRELFNQHILGDIKIKNWYRVCLMDLIFFRPVIF